MSLLPDLIVIGAEKCGTTTLWEDLRGHPRIHVGEKESRVLLGAGLDPAEVLRRYDRHLRGAPDGALLGEVSTRYSMLPDNPEAPQNAKAVVPNAKIVYIVRDPLQRVISHHHHDFGLGLVRSDVDWAVANYAPLLANTRYASQVEPWLEAFGVAAVRIVKFEDYMADRAGGFSALLRLVGIEEPFDPGDGVHNAADTKRVAKGTWARVAHNRLYRRLRPLIGEQVRRRVGHAVLPKAPARPSGPAAATIDRLVAELAPEVERLSEMTGGLVHWDLEASAERLRGLQR